MKLGKIAISTKPVKDAVGKVEKLLWEWIMVSARSFGDLFFIQSDERDKRIVENWIFDKYSDIQTEESLEHGFYFTPHLVRDEESKKHAISFLNRLYKAENTNDIHRPIIIGFSDHESDECALSG